MKVGVVLFHAYDNSNFIYGMSILEKEGVSMYDVREKVQEIVSKIFQDSLPIEWGFSNKFIVKYVDGSRHHDMYYKTADGLGIL